jgi:hypothetical protein
MAVIPVRSRLEIGLSAAEYIGQKGLGAEGLDELLGYQQRGQPGGVCLLDRDRPAVQAGAAHGVAAEERGQAQPPLPREPDARL